MEQRIGNWIINKGEALGYGGNGVVYLAVSEDRTKRGAFKMLKRWDDDKSYYDRFKREVRAYQTWKDIEGVLPLLDSYLPNNPRKGDRPFLVLALAKTLPTALGMSPLLTTVVDACRDIGRTLETIHKRGGSHRDIKPNNLFCRNERWMIGDLGLATLPDDVGITETGEKVGPAEFIAPEMLNRASESDGRMADVYSLSKTLWVLGTGVRRPPPGEIRAYYPEDLLSSHSSDPRAALLDPLIERATKRNPGDRPSMSEFVQELEGWAHPAELDSSGSDDLDLSSYAERILSLNVHHGVDEQKRQDEEHFLNHTRGRMAESFRPLVSEIHEALVNAKFVNCKNNAHVELRCFGGIAGSGSRRGGGISFSVHIEVLSTRVVKIACVYGGTGRQQMETFWDQRTSFLAGGQDERNKIQTLIADSKRALRPSIEKLLDYLQKET